MATGDIIDFVEISLAENGGNAKALAEAREPLWAGQFLETEELYKEASSYNLKMNLDEGKYFRNEWIAFNIVCVMIKFLYFIRP